MLRPARQNAKPPEPDHAHFPNLSVPGYALWECTVSAAHTPGPWTAKNISGAGWGVWADLRPALGEKFSKDFPLNGSEALSTQKIQVAYETWVQFPSEAFNAMQSANMALMAAAPDLLEALKAVRPYLNAGEALIVDAAILKATGAAS